MFLQCNANGRHQNENTLFEVFERKSNNWKPFSTKKDASALLKDCDSFEAAIVQINSAVLSVNKRVAEPTEFFINANIANFVLAVPLQMNKTNEVINPRMSSSYSH